MQPSSSFTIRQATLQEVYDFFHQATEKHFQGIMPMLFDPERLKKCNAVFVAECAGHIVGAVTLAFNGVNGPTLDTGYVLPAYRRRRIGYSLCETAMRCFQAEGKTPVFCDVNSRGMHTTLQWLPSDLQAILKVNLAYQKYGELDLPEHLEE